MPRAWGRLHRCMAEPQGKHRAVHTVLAECPSGSMAKDRGCDALVLERVAGLPGCRHGVGQQIRSPVAAEPTAAGVRTPGGPRPPWACAQPPPPCRCRCLSPRGAARLPSCAGAGDRGSRPTHDVWPRPARACRPAPPGWPRDQSSGPVPPSGPGCRPGGLPEGGQLRAGQAGAGGRRGPCAGEGQAPGAQGALWRGIPRGSVAAGRPRGHARLATAGPGPPRLLPRRQQGAEPRRVERRQAERRRRRGPPLLGPLQEETTRGTVARHRVGTRVPWVPQPRGQIGWPEVGQRGRRWPRGAPLGRGRGLG